MICKYRNEIKKVARDGTTEVVGRCANVACESFAKNVSEDICAACPLKTLVAPVRHQIADINRSFEQPKRLKDGTLVYKREGWEPPRVPQGYRRKSDDLRSDDAWVLVPEWTPCRDREFANTVASCGCVTVHAVCVSMECPRKGRQVTPSICAGCPHVRPNPTPTIEIAPDKPCPR